MLNYVFKVESIIFSTLTMFTCTKYLISSPYSERQYSHYATNQQRYIRRKVDLQENEYLKAESLKALLCYILLNFHNHHHLLILYFSLRE